MSAIETITQAEYQALVKEGLPNKHGSKRCKVHKPAHDSQRECEPSASSLNLRRWSEENA